MRISQILNEMEPYCDVTIDGKPVRTMNFKEYNVTVLKRIKTINFHYDGSFLDAIEIITSTEWETEE